MSIDKREDKACVKTAFADPKNYETGENGRICLYKSLHGKN